MKCPLSTKVEGVARRIEEYSFGDCIKEECAWWNQFTEECSIYMIALETSALRAAMQEIKTKMLT